ncbi:putative acyl carrier protein [Treponema socranskii subsp. socranskii VPI DR56BR1116 = ATCC 35536]|uniref:Acyl carrier protein n=2 Tax=Treponema socranskii subsp. socranskii VPI DR56BR1116 = ATCC 35536 TaxID=1125725 RepID=A0ABP2YJZ1_TRESO|nr:putative acyl carrier protein [Treponema socranskii subsp. socranskii VPI DR56BR1116 = ATCC 35536]
MYMTKEEIFDKLKAILSKEFEIEEDKITPAAKLADDLELDSIDSIDLIVKMKDFIPGKVDPAIFKTVKTMQDVVDALYPYTQQA